MSHLAKLPRLSSRKGLHVFEDGRNSAAYSISHDVILACGPDGANGAVVPITFDGENFAFQTSSSAAYLPTIVTALAVSNCGNYLAIANNERDIAVYDLPTYTLVGNVANFTLAPRSIAFSPDDQFMYVTGVNHTLYAAYHHLMHCSAAGGDDRVVKIASRTSAAAAISEIIVGRAIKCIAYDPLGKYLVVSCQDGSVSVYDMSVDAKPLVKRPEACKMSEPNEPRYSTVEYPVTWHPKGEVFAVASDAGAQIYARDTFLQVYHLRSPNAPHRPEEVWSGTCALAWSPNGRYLLAIDGRRIATVWDVTSAAVDPVTKMAVRKGASGAAGEPAIAMHGYISVVVPEGDGDDLSMASAPDDLPKMEAKSASPRITALLWMKDGSTIAFLDSMGNIGCAKIAKLLERNGESVVEEVVQPFSWPLNVGVETPEERQPVGQTAVDDLAGVDMDAFLDEVVESNSVAESEAGKVPHRPVSDAEPLALSLADLKRRHGFVDADGDDEGLQRIDEDMPNIGSKEMQEIISRGGIVTKSHLAQHAISTGKFVQEVYGFAQEQPPFQSSSTCFLKNRGRRYLTWNSVGTITCRREPAGNVISVDFHDSTKHRNVTFTDVNGFTLGTMQHHGALFAAPYIPPSTASGNEEATEDGIASLIRFKSFGGFGSGSLDWALTLPVTNPRKPSNKFSTRPGSLPDAKKASGGGGDLDAADLDGFIADDIADGEGALDDLLDTSDAAESAVALAMGEGWCAVGTDQQNLRFFRSGGLQDMVYTLPGNIVTMAGCGSLCAVAYHDGMPSGFRQRLAVDVYLFRCSVEGSTLPRKLVTLSLPMRPHALLQWLGFAPNGILLMHDSLGTLFTATPSLDWAWSPACNTKLAALHGGDSSVLYGGQAKSIKHDPRDSFWPVDVIMAPPSVSSAPESLSKTAITLPGGVIPTLVAVLCKGSNKFPSVAKPLPLTNYLPLRIPLIDSSGSSEAIQLDEMFLRHEAMRLHRQWMTRLGLSNVSSVALPMAAALASASANARGVPMDAAIALETQLTEHREANRQHSTAMDKAVLASIKLACENDHELKAVQLATRLHSEKSYAIAQKIAGATGTANAGERFAQMLTARDAVEHASLGFVLEPTADGVVDPASLAQTAPRRRGGRVPVVQAEGEEEETAARTKYGLTAIPGLSKPRGIVPAPPAHLAAAPPASLSTSTASALAALGEVPVEQPTNSVAGGSPPGAMTRDNSALNPFSKKFTSSPKRSRQSLENITKASPSRENGPALNRQTSFATSAREAKRARHMTDAS